MLLYINLGWYWLKYRQTAQQNKKKRNSRNRAPHKHNAVVYSETAEQWGKEGLFNQCH